jgi:hypothetical protein
MYSSYFHFNRFLESSLLGSVIESLSDKKKCSLSAEKAPDQTHVISQRRTSFDQANTFQRHKIIACPLLLRHKRLHTFQMCSTSRSNLHRYGGLRNTHMITDDENDDLRLERFTGSLRIQLKILSKSLRIPRIDLWLCKVSCIG